jgi:DMSO/TMAO reductase YedYZ molybdopterin-dependent catalytic subunit
MAEHRKVITQEPENSETPLEEVRSWVTPTPWFFVRNHFDLPAIDLASWRLHVDGCVERPAAWTYDQLIGLPERTVFATLECAGNGRSFLHTKQQGVPWGAGAIGHAEWTGVPLRLVLDKAGLQPGTVEIVCQGADQGSEPDHPETMPFARSLPLPKALDRDTLLVFRMNGELLEPVHGFPLRLLVPGWYGVASVKWLNRLVAVPKPFQGYFQSNKYTIQQASPNGVHTVIVREMTIKSEILRPRSGDVLGLGTNRLFGLAWAGEDTVARVEFSTDDGRTWAPADLIGPRAPYSWTLWEFLWEIAEPGSYLLLVRAISAGGRVQPIHHDPLNGGYLIHHSRPTLVRVEPARRSHDHRADPDTILYDMNAFAEENTRFPLDVEMEFAQGEGI